MKGAALFLVLSMVVLMAQPGECIFGWIAKGIGALARHIHGAIHGKEKLTKEQADQQQLDQQQLDQQQLDQRQLDQEDQAKQQLEQQQLDQEEQAKQQLDERSFKNQFAHRRFD
ncbi:pleurocidin-like peptide WF3 [Girardinichthys multiradiatus]|uniref:pleurocidin-like peptide WF3 n=1 Tax=Girardinichthys multiradiatus TaxID=208333 RepID=UPI001FAD2CE6|nr:pleurocidin-like peptide WF3 [Girardinichthys multiradiatus]